MVNGEPVDLPLPRSLCKSRSPWTIRMLWSGLPSWPPAPSTRSRRRCETEELHPEMKVQFKILLRLRRRTMIWGKAESVLFVETS
jgi:hypothetical protein